MNINFFKKSVCLFLLAAMAAGSTGCSEFLASISAKEASKILTEAIDAFIEDPVNGLDEYDEDYSVPDMPEQSLEFAAEAVAETSYELGEARVNKNRTKVEIPVTFHDVRLIDGISMGTEAYIEEALGNADTRDVEVTFVLKGQKGDWTIDDMSELIDVFFVPYESLVFVDENGMPTSFYEPFFDESLIDSVWYDPVMSNPLDANSLISPEAMLAVFYFDRPMYLELTADLIKDGEVVQSEQIVLNGETTAACSFWGQDYGAGSYTVEILFDGGTAGTTASLTVR